MERQFIVTLLFFNTNQSVILISDSKEPQSDTSIKINGFVKQNSTTPLTEISFEYGISENLGMIVKANPSGSYYFGTLPISQILTNLLPNVKYYYKISAKQNGVKLYSDLYEFTLNPLMVSDVSINDVVKVYPNPVSTIINFDSKEEISKIEIYDLSGKLMLTKVGENVRNLNIKNFANSVYVMKIFTANNIYSARIIKQ